MTLTTWFSLFTICLLGAMSPGPSLAIVAKHSLSGGRINGFATAWAHACGIGIYALVTVLGLTVLLQQFPMIFKSLSLIGALYLAWLGYNAVRSKGGIVERLESGQPVSAVTSAKEGLFISLFSPKIALFFTALFSQFVAVGSELSDKAIIIVTPLLVDGLWYTFITIMLSSTFLLNFLKSKARIIDQVSGVVLILLAIRVLFTL
ncbi:MULTISPECIES: LysE family translocator [Vibrio]|uniref:LysE family translocator n=1 Tax=Vibrio TaxID=662 RepID=UPI003D0F764D